HPRHVAPGLGVPGHEAAAQRVTDEGEHDGHALRRVLRGLSGRLLTGEDQVDTDVERHVAPVFEAQLLQPSLEHFDSRMTRRPRGVEDADPERTPSLLRLAREREGADKQRRGEPEDPLGSADVAQLTPPPRLNGPNSTVVQDTAIPCSGRGRGDTVISRWRAT